MLLLVIGCRDRGGSPASQPASTPLTPAEYVDLSSEEKSAAKTVTIYVPDYFGDGELPPTAGPWASPLDRVVNEGNVDRIAYYLNRALFQLAHPRVHVESIPFDMWGAEFRTLLATSLTSARGPAVYIARDLPDTIDEGLYADVTDLLADWPAARDHKLTRSGGSFGGRVYCIPGVEQAVEVILYRKDYFRDASVFNEFGEPGPPTNWTWHDFRRIAKRLTRDVRRGDATQRVWGFCAEQYRFDALAVACNRVPLFVPDRSGRFTWRFNADDPRLAAALREARAMRTEDGSIRAGVEYNWTIKTQEFEAGRVAMAVGLSNHPVYYAVQQPNAFGADVNAAEAIGMVLPPCDDFGVRELRNTSNLFGFNPTYTREQLAAAIAYFRSYACGAINANNLSTRHQYNALLGRPDPYPEYELVRAYESEVAFPPHAGAEVFPPDFRRAFDTYRRAVLAPQPAQFGLKEPVRLADALNAVYSEVLFSARPVEAILRDSAETINRTCMHFKVAGDREKLRAYYEAYLDYARRTMPPAAADEAAQFVETRCKVW